MTDWELLQRFVASQDEAAFAEIVRRHLDFVHASARRQVGADHAPDVAQAVFVILSRKAASLGRDVVLSSWLFRTTRFVAAQARRGETRRFRREQEVARLECADFRTGGRGEEVLTTAGRTVAVQLGLQPAAAP